MSEVLRRPQVLERFVRCVLRRSGLGSCATVVRGRVVGRLDVRLLMQARVDQFEVVHVRDEALGQPR